MRPTLLLDIDDVICLNRPVSGVDVVQHFRTGRRDPLDWSRLFESEAVAILVEVLEAFQPRVVVTSSWAMHFVFEQFQVIFTETGLGAAFHALHEEWCVQPRRGETRVGCVRRWLALHHRGEPYVVVDDDHSGGGLAGSELERDGRLVLCEANVGLARKHLNTIHTALSRPAPVGLPDSLPLVEALAVHVIGTPQLAYEWLHDRHPDLQRRRPIDLLSTSSGRAELVELLQRLRSQLREAR